MSELRIFACSSSYQSVNCGANATTFDVSDSAFNITAAQSASLNASQTASILQSVQSLLEQMTEFLKSQ